jgi:hypothetical protein
MKDGWEKFSMPSYENVFHVVPVNDIEHHTIPFKTVLGMPIALCKCKPRLDAQAEYYGKDITVFIHNSFDGREAVEWANALLITPKE